MDDEFLQQVKELHEKGLSQRDIADSLGVKRNRIQSALKKLYPHEDSKALVPIDQVRAIIQEEFKKAREEEKENEGRFPMVRKWGGGMETVASEAILKQYMGGSPEEELELRAIMKFRAAMLMVMDLVNIQKGNAEADAERMMPILRLMKETREEQDAAAARAKSSSEEIADRAAHQTASEIYEVVSQNTSRINDSINQIRQVLGEKDDNPFAQFVSSVNSMQQMLQMFGLATPGTAGIQGGGQADQWQPPPITRKKKE
jgi:hypothetical protein